MEKKLTAQNIQALLDTVPPQPTWDTVLVPDFSSTYKPGKKATRRVARTEAAIAAGRKTFSQIREELAARDPDRYAFRNPGTRKTGMVAVNATRIYAPKK